MANEKLMVPWTGTCDKAGRIAGNNQIALSQTQPSYPPVVMSTRANDCAAIIEAAIGRHFASLFSGQIDARQFLAQSSPPSVYASVYEAAAKVERIVAKDVEEEIRRYAFAQGVRIDYQADPRGWLTGSIQHRLNATLHSLQGFRAIVEETLRHNQTAPSAFTFSALLGLGKELTERGLLSTLCHAAALLCEDLAAQAEHDQVLCYLREQFQIRFSHLANEVNLLRQGIQVAAQNYWSQEIASGQRVINEERALYSKSRTTLTEQERKNSMWYAIGLAAFGVILICFFIMYVLLFS